MDATLDYLISDFHERPIPEVVPRAHRLPDVPRKAVTLIGMRRTGKTYALYDAMRRRMAEGVTKSRIFYLNLEDERLGEPTTETLDRALELFYRRFPASREGPSHLFFDEIQVVPGWERFMRRVVDTEAGRIYATGSSARLLSTEVATAFRGRAVAVEVLPFSLREAARSHGVELGATWPPGASTRSRLAELMDQHLARGGFPEVQHVHPFDRAQILQDYVELVALKDVAERHGATNLTALRRLVRALFSANAGPFSISKVHGALVSQGVKVGKATLYAYLEHLQDAYLAFLVPIRSRSEKQRMVNPRKVYAIDTGLAAAMRVGGARDLGAQLENFVYLELRHRLGRLATNTITYYRTASGREVDFAIDPVLPGGGLSLVQVCASLDHPETRERELRGLTEAMTETGTREATLVTLGAHESISVTEGAIRVVPAWEWALEPGPSRGSWVRA